MFEIVTTSHRGKRPSTQQDALFDGVCCVQSADLVPNSHLIHAPFTVAVADGVSVSVQPHRASLTAVTLLQKLCAQSELNPKLIRALHVQLCEQLAKGQTYGSSTTLVAAQIVDNLCTIINVGDSRAYLLNSINSNRQWTQLSRDHTIINGLIERGEASPDMEYAGIYNGLEHCLVADFEEFEFAVHHTKQRINAGDTLLLCSDGVHDELGDEYLFSLLDARLTLIEQAQVWRDAVLRTGASDNFSMILARAGGALSQSNQGV